MLAGKTSSNPVLPMQQAANPMAVTKPLFEGDKIQRLKYDKCCAIAAGHFSRVFPGIDNIGFDQRRVQQSLGRLLPG